MPDDAASTPSAVPAPFIEVAIRASDEFRGQIVALMGLSGFEGFWEDGDILRCYVPEGRWSASLRAEVDDVLRQTLGTEGPAGPPVTVSRIENIDWNAEWEKTIRPIRVGRRIVIAPSWHPHAAGPDDVVLTIDPKMSFGTGYHESTRLIIRMLEDDVRPGARVLDIGTGTGVLAIAALKLGAASAVGVDIDEWSDMNARENAVINGVSADVTIIRGTLADISPGTFTLILANIQRSVLVRLMPEMAARLAPSGTLLLSGLLLGDEEEIVREAQSAGLAVARRATENEWLALGLRAHIPTHQ